MGMIYDKRTSHQKYTDITFTTSTEHHFIWMPRCEGWGLNLDGNFTVTKVIPGRMADLAGVKSGWRLWAFQKPTHPLKGLWGRKNRNNREEWKGVNHETAVTLVFHKPKSK